MTVEVADAVNVVDHDGNGVATTFSMNPILVYDTSHISVKHYDASDVETTITEGTGATNYSVSLTSAVPSGGSIIYPADQATPLPSGERIRIRYTLPLEQDTDLQNQGTYFPDVLEQQLDLLLKIDVQQDEVISRAFKLPAGDDSGVAPEIPSFSGNANKYLRVDSDAGGVGWAAISTAAASASDATPQGVSLSAGAAGTGADFARDDHVHLLPTVTVAKGGTGAVTAAAARTNLAVAEMTDAEKAQHDVGYSLATYFHGGF